MTYSAVDTAIIKSTDRFASIREEYKAVIAASASSLWTIRDVTADETYENRIDGTATTLADASFKNANIGKLEGVNTWMSNHDTYFKSDLGYSTGWAGYFDATHLRVHENFADTYYEARGARLAAKYIAAANEKTANVLGTLAYNAAGAAEDVASLSTTVGLTRLGAEVTTAIVGAALDIDVTATDGTNTTVITALAVPVGSAGDITPLLSVTPTGFTHDTTTVITMANTAGFVASTASLPTYALVVNDTFANEFASQTVLKEYVQITAVSANTSITVTALTNQDEFITANVANIRVYPCFRGVTALEVNDATGVTGGAIKIVPINDRTPAL